MAVRPRTALPEGWDTGATEYDTYFVPHFADFAADALRLAKVTPGCRVLDVATGPGTLALHAANMGASVVATDFSPAMIARLRSHIAEGEGTNIAAEVMDGQSLALPDASFDAAFSMFGLIFFPDRAAGFRELHRVLRSGGVAGVSTWSRPEKSPFGTLFRRAVRRAFPDRPAPPPPQLGTNLEDPQVFAREMQAAGFAPVTIHTVAHMWEIAAPDAHWDTLLSQPVTATFTDGEKEAIRATLREIGREEFGDGPMQIETEAHIAIGVK